MIEHTTFVDSNGKLRENSRTTRPKLQSARLERAIESLQQARRDLFKYSVDAHGREAGLFAGFADEVTSILERLP